MKSFVARYVDTFLLRSSLIMLVGSASINVSNYLFHIVMGRMLGPAGYGALASLVAILYVISVPVSSIQMAGAKMVAELDNPESHGRIAPFMAAINRRLFLVSLTGIVVIAVSSPFVASFIKVRVSSVLIIGGVSLVALALPGNRGGLHGLKRFAGLSANMASETFLKLGLGAALVLLGLGLDGALLGMLAGASVALIFSFWLIRRIGLENTGPVEKFDSQALLANIRPIFLAFLAVTLVYNIDVVMARHFMSPDAAGQYAGLATLGKIAFFAPLAVSAAMFPMASQAGDNEAISRPLLHQAMMLTAAISLSIDIAYFVAPRLVVGILIGPQYADIIPYLGLMGLAMSFLAISNCFYYYELSRKRTGFIGWLLVAAVLEVVFIGFFHWGILPVVVTVFAASLLLLIGTAGTMALRTHPGMAGSVELNTEG